MLTLSGRFGFSGRAFGMFGRGFGGRPFEAFGILGRAFEAFGMVGAGAGALDAGRLSRLYIARASLSSSQNVRAAYSLLPAYTQTKIFK